MDNKELEKLLSLGLSNINKPKIIFSRVDINKDLLGFDFSAFDKDKSIKENFAGYFLDEVSANLPKGKVIGVKFNSYVDENSFNDYYKDYDSKDAFIIGRTEIMLKDSRSLLLVDPSDIKDFKIQGGGYLKDFKKVSIELEVNEPIKIEFNTTGNIMPICGEFIFAIEDKCGCEN